MGHTFFLCRQKESMAKKKLAPRLLDHPTVCRFTGKKKLASLKQLFSELFTPLLLSSF
jgi:hypothetical protein